MPFNSYEFAVFFTVFLLIYYMSARISVKMQNAVLLIGSYCFYAYVNIWLCILPMYLTLVQFVIGGKLSKSVQTGAVIRSKHLIIYSIALSLLPLLLLKYSFLIKEAWVLPLGLSFYTLQSMTYCFDIYNNKIERTTLYRTALFVSFFPTLLSGPIERSRNIIPQIGLHLFNSENIISGGKSMIWGLFLKTVIANRLQEYVDTIYYMPDAYSGLTLSVAAVAYSLQIFADFCGYSMMAVGCAKMLGYDVMKNFDAPYLAKSFKDFWHRWNISLTSWFTEYVYIPLGGNRVCENRWFINIVIVFLLSGIWHGVTFTFIVWGLFHAMMYIVDTKLIKKENIIHSILVFVCVTVAWIFFRSPDMTTALTVICRIITNHDSYVYLGSSTFSLIISIPFILLVFYKMYLEYYKKSIRYAEPFFYALLMSIVVLFGTDSTRFIYMKF